MPSPVRSAESLVRWGIPTSFWGTALYDRREIKDSAYLRLLINPADTVSLLRVINVPKRSIGKTTIQRLTDAANQLGIPLWDMVSDPEAVRSLGGRAKGCFSSAIWSMISSRAAVRWLPRTDSAGDGEKRLCQQLIAVAPMKPKTASQLAGISELCSSVTRRTRRVIYQFLSVWLFMMPTTRTPPRTVSPW